MQLIGDDGTENSQHAGLDQQLSLYTVFSPLTITVTKISVNGNTSIPLTLTIIVTEIHAKPVT